MDNDRTYGIEIEISRLYGRRAQREDCERIANELTANGIRARVSYYGSSDESEGGAWKVHWDGSAGPEIVSPPMRGQDGLDEIKRVCEVLNSMDAAVDSSCGLHVHHDVSDLDEEQMVRVTAIYSANQDGINSLLPRSRRMNHYCHPVGWNQFAEATVKARVDRATADVAPRYKKGYTANAIANGTRYQAINWQAFQAHGTVEFRQHSGTTSAEKIGYWVMLTQAIVVAGKHRKSPVTSANPEALANLWRAVYGAGQLKDDENYWNMKKYFLARRETLASAN